MRLKGLTNNIWFKRLGLPFLVLLFLTLITALFINLYFSPILSTQLKKAVFRLSNGLYQVDFTGSSLNVLTGHIVIEHLSLKPDTAVFDRQKRAGKAPNSLYILLVKKIVFKHFHPFKLYFKKELDVDDLVIGEPSVQLIYQEQHNHDVTDSSKKTVYQSIAGTLKSVHIGKILLNNINLRYQEETAGRIKVTRFKEVDVRGTDLLIDPASQNDKNRFDFCKDITAIFNNYTGSTANGLYLYRARSLVFSSAKASVKIIDAVFMPQKSSIKTPQLQRRNFRLETDSIQVNHFDYRAFISYRKLVAADITVFGGKANLFYDRTIPRVPADSARNFGLYARLKNVHRNIAVNALHLKDLDVVYTEISPKTKLSGAITFKKLNGTVNNIVTGADTLRQTNRKLTANLSAYLMGYGKLNVNISFDPSNSANLLYYKGNMGPMNLVNLNPATKPLGLIQFTNGIVTGLSFDMQANAAKATGKVVFLYHDLNVMLLKENEKNAFKRMSFISILANAFVLIRDNPRFNDPVRVENVVYERPENTSYLGMLWRSIYTGIKESIGLSAQIEKDLRQRATDYKQNKNDRLLKKENRMEKRKIRRLKRIQKRQLKEVRKG